MTGLVLGVISFAVVIAFFAAGLCLVPVALIGLPVMGVAVRFASGFAAAERGRLRLLLDRRLARWPADPQLEYWWGIIPTTRFMGTRKAWGPVLYAALRLPLSLVFFTVTVALWSAGVAGLTAPLYAGALPGGGLSVAAHAYPGDTAVIVAGLCGLVALLAAAPVTRGLATADVALARLLLAPPRDAELRARVSELEVSRERVVDAAEAERRRIERDLHDGAQQRLVALAMELGRAKAKLADDVEAAAVLVGQAHADAKAALTELRDLVRGVHPPVLTDRGLDAALSGLAARCPVPVSLQVDVLARPRPAVEAVAYFTVAEALTNVAKHSRASHASVVVEGGGDRAGALHVVISDDGVGGADAGGAGLAGLADRIAGVDGSLSVESPPGGPTIVSAVLPC